MVNVDSGTKRVCHNRKAYYNCETFQHDRPFKKRRLFDQSSVVTSDGGVSSDTYSNLPGKSMKVNKSDSDDLLCEGIFLPHDLYDPIIRCLEFCMALKFQYFTNSFPVQQTEYHL